MKCTERIGLSASPSWCQDRPPSLVPSRLRAPTAQPVVVLMKSTPTNSSVDANCFVQCAPSLVAKIACDPTAHPSRGPTIWIAERAGTKRGSRLEGVGVGLAAADGAGVFVGEALAAGAFEIGVGIGLTADVEVQPASTAASVAAHSGANRRGMVLQRESVTCRAAHRRAMMRSRHMTYAQSENANSVRSALGGLLRQRRDEAERSLVEVATSAGLSAAYLSEVERGLKDISTDKLMALARALELSLADLYLNVARQLGSREAMQQQRSWPDDPRMQLRIATASLRPHALRSVADFSVYLAATQATPPRRRIGFTVDR